MNTTNDNHNQLKENIDNIDDYTLKKILELLEVRQTPIWWSTEHAETEGTPLATSITDLIDEKQLSFEQVKQMYPHWFEN